MVCFQKQNYNKITDSLKTHQITLTFPYPSFAGLVSL